MSYGAKNTTNRTLITIKAILAVDIASYSRYLLPQNQYPKADQK